MASFDDSKPLPSEPVGANTNGTTLKDTVVNMQSISKPLSNLPALTPIDAASAVNAVQNHPITQNIANGPVAISVKTQVGQTSDEFGGLANSRTAPNYSAANDTPLTHYHSFFYTLLSWEHPRATGITFAATILFIFACRYLPVIRYILKISYMTLGVVTLAEVAAKFVAGTSVTSSIRPRRYYTIPKETLEASLDDLEQFINFFVIEVQRIVFAENIPVTGAAFTAAFISYYLVKILPMWGMALLATCVIYLLPLVYVTNKEVIDAHVEHASTVVSQQATQVKDLTAQHAGKGFEAVKSYTGEYASKASEIVGTARQKIPVPVLGQSQPSGVKEGDFPTAPKAEFPSVAEHSKPIVTAPTQGEPIAASAT